MRRRPSARELAGLVILAGAASLATSRFAGAWPGPGAAAGTTTSAGHVEQGPKSTDDDDQPDKTYGERFGKLIRAGDPIPPEFQNFKPSIVPMISSYGLEMPQLDSNEGIVSLHAKLDLLHNRPHKPLVWVLRLYDSTGKNVLSQRIYRDQQFQVPLGQRKASFFDESFPLDPGDYNLELALYTVPENQAFDQLDIGSPAEPRLREARMIRSVTVAP